MMKKMLGVFTSIVAALAVVGVAWASGDDGASTSITAATGTSANVSTDVRVADSTVADSTVADSTVADSTPSTAVTTPDSSTSTSVDSSSTTSTSIAESTSSSAGTDTTTSTTVESTTSTSVDDDDNDEDDDDNEIDIEASVVADGITSHTIPGVGSVTIEVFGGQLFLVNVNAPGWDVEHDKIESDRIELEFTSGDAEAEFEARIKDARVEVEIEVGDD